MTFFITQTLNGIVFGSLLFIFASGLVLMLGLMRIINLAHGSYYLLGGYIGFSIAQHTGNFLLASLGGLLAIGIIGMLMYKAILQQHFAREELSQVLITFGILLIFADLCRWTWGGVPLIIPKPEMFQGSIHLGEIVYPIYRLAIIMIGAMVAFLLWWFQERTKYGAIIRAGVDDEEMAQGIGINISLVKTLVFGLGALLAGFAGVIGGPIVGLYPGLDIEILLLALVVIIIGGMGSLWGALVGALLIGLLDCIGKSVFPELSMFTIFGLMAIVLIIKPRGLFGTK